MKGNYEMIVKKIGLSNKACAISVETECPSLNQINILHTVYALIMAVNQQDKLYRRLGFRHPFKLRNGYVKIVRKF